MDIKIRVETLMGKEFGEVCIFFSKNHLPPVFLIEHLTTIDRPPREFQKDG